MKVRSKFHTVSSWLVLGVLLVLSVLFGFISSSKPTNSVRTRAAAPPGGKTISVTGSGAPAIQQAIDTAGNGDTIMIPAGIFSGNTALPMGLGDGIHVSDARGAANTCFIRIENKNLTIKGPGAIIFGEGHDKPYMDPYQTRAGICIVNSQVTIDGVRVKEFQKRCIVVYNSTLIYKNGVIEGCDEGGASLLGDSAGLFVNNKFAEMNFGGVMLWQNSTAKIVNNIFHNAAVLFFYHYPQEQPKAEIINNVFTGIKSTVAQVDWWKATEEQKKLNTLSYNLFWNERPECDRVYQFWCDAFPGKIYADPLYQEPVTDPRGIAAWANFGFREGSPAVGVGDPLIPGPKNLGDSGGPCVDGASSMCINFISQNAPKPPVPPTPTQPPIPPTDVPMIYPTDPPQLPPTEISNTPGITHSSSSSMSPVNFSFEQKGPSGILIIENTGFGTLRIDGLLLKNNYIAIDKRVETGLSIQYPISSVCRNNDESFSGSVLYSDEKNSLSYATIQIYCNRTNIFDIE